jgi:hypothetical protein
MAYTLKANGAKLVTDQYGKHIEINRVGIYNDDKFVKWVKITELVMQALIRDRALTDQTAQKIIEGNV